MNDALPIARGKRVLDLGCNDGYGSSLLASGGIAVVGVDVSTKSLREAAAAYRMPSLRFVPVDGIKLPFRDDAFDMVVSFK
jgi:SAM-dependent methyltransferase